MYKVTVWTADLEGIATYEAAEVIPATASVILKRVRRALDAGQGKELNRVIILSGIVEIEEVQ